MRATYIDASLRDLLSRVPAGTPKCVFVEAVDETLSALERSAGGQAGRRFVVLRWHEPPRIDDAVRLVLQEIASVARAAWPFWFGLNGSIDLPGHDRLLDIATKTSLSPDWIRRAWSECQQDRLPLAAEYSPVIALKHLTAVIGEGELDMVMAVDSADPTDVHLDGICRVTQWLAANSHARCSLLLCAALYGSPELASVDYEPFFWSVNSRRPPRGEESSAAENKLRLWPVLGQPHPLSPGEQKLCQSLLSDSLLVDLFRFNCPVTTRHGNTYVVDLLSAELKVVVEVDGYTHHSNRVAFSMDRQRDYELHTSGYLVLRLPHDDVINDIDACLEKIRHFVVFRQQHPLAIG